MAPTLRTPTSLADECLIAIESAWTMRALDDLATAYQSNASAFTALADGESNRSRCVGHAPQGNSHARDA